MMTGSTAEAMTAEKAWLALYFFRGVEDSTPFSRRV